MNELVLQNVSASIGGQPLFPAISLTVCPGDVVAIMGPSGAGKSTLLNFVLGQMPSGFTVSGEVRLGPENLQSLPTEHRKIGLVAQDDWLFPHMTVWQNLRFAQPKGLSRSDASEQIMHFLSKAGLQDIAKKRPNQLSGGQRQRVAVLRMLLSKPKAVLLDEPFSKLDQQLRADFRQWCFETLASWQLPALLVTHDVQDIPVRQFWQIDKGDWQNA